MLKIKNFLSYILYSYVLNHKTVLDYQNIPTYSFSSSNIKIITLSTNNIVQTPAGYFRICRRWRRKKIYDKETYRIYKTLIGGGQILDKQLVAFVSHETEKYSRINPFFTYDTFSANRAISSYRIAKLLGNERLLTKCMFCWLTVDGSEPLLGTMSEIANGIGFWDFECNIADKATPSLLRDLSNLEIMDSICHEPDHGANNYKLKLDDKGNIAHICAFDNDNPRDFYISSNLQHLLTTETKTMVADNGNFGRNYADEILVDRLLSLTKREFYKELKPYLNCVQLYFCWSRIKMLKKAITKSLSCNKLYILKQDEWNQIMVGDEVNGLNGRTYLYVLCDWRNYYSNAGQRKGNN